MAAEPVTYELWETETRNIIDWFDDEERALAFVGAVVAGGDLDAVASWSLIRTDSIGQSYERWEDAALLARALAALS